ncbi:hypothetical protein FocTR4_00014550 [Fusarium oxysporum f. sp. cubense]|nr:hypothetical protein FocTR4_00014550 [Fusarium oxysporum f. sp. cubense]
MRLTALYAVITVAVDRLGALAEGLPVVINVPRVASDDAASLDPSPVSFSLPFAGLPGYFPGIPLTLKCLGTFKDVSSKWPPIRIGGTSEDYATFDPNLAVPNVITGTAPTGQGISTYGPLLMQLVADYQGPIVWGLNRGGNNITNTIAAAKAAVKQLPSLYALELGNEPVMHNKRLDLRFAQPQAAAMASSTTNPPAAPDPFDLGIHTPANLNRGARAALLQNSPAAVNSTIGVSPGPRRMAQTPSSPLSAATIAAATEGAARGNLSSTFEQQPVSIIESANDLARERIEEYNAKLMVFQAFCTKFEEAAQQFTTGPHRRFAQQFADSFLDSWKRELSSAGPTIPKPTYSSVAAASPRTDRDRLTHRQPQQHGRRQTDPPHRQGQQRTIAPPRQDLRVFIRLEAGAPARAHSSYAIRTLIQEKLGAVSNKIRQVFQVRSGWAVLTADSETRDFLVEKQAEWAAELGATTVETNKEWFTYVVSDFPTRLTDFHGKEVDSDSIVSDEIEIQTGLKPIDIRPSRQFSDNPLTKTLLVSFLKPIKRFWSLFGSSAARLIDKTDRPRQCETCWGYHFARNCHRQPVCQRCGKTGHIIDNCTAPEQCINCLGPHQANFRKCPARPKRVHGVLRRLTKEQRGHVRTVGAEAYRQRHLAQQPESHLEAQQSDDIASHEQPSIRGPSPAASGAPSCIMVATSPQAGYEAEEEPEHPRPGSPRKRRIVLITRPLDQE